MRGEAWLGLLACAITSKASQSDTIKDWAGLRGNSTIQKSGSSPLEALGCGILPNSLQDRTDVQTLDLHAASIIQDDESCLNRAIMLCAQATTVPSALSIFLRRRCPRVPETTWPAILKVIKEHDVSLFTEKLLVILRCIPYLEMLAPYIKGVGGFKGDNGRVVRLIPLFYILKRPGLKSQKLQEEFQPILKAREEEPAVFWSTIERFLQESGYLSKALADEARFFETNSWLIRTFAIDRPTVQALILKNDYYHLAYLMFQRGVDERMVTSMLENASYCSLALYLGRNQPRRVTITGRPPAPHVGALIRLYNHTIQGQPSIVPCSKRGTSPTQVPIRDDLFRQIKGRNRQAMAVNMIVKRLFDIPFGILPKRLSKSSGRSLAKAIRTSLIWYCGEFKLEPSVNMIRVKPKPPRLGISM